MDLVKIIHSYMALKDSMNLRTIEMIKTLKLTDTDLLVSCDVTSLFTKVLFDDVTNRLDEVLTHDLANLVIHSLPTFHFFLFQWSLLRVN